MERFIIDSHGPDADAERDAFRWLLGQARERGAEAAVIVPGVDNIRALARVLGSGPAERAKRDRVLTISGVTVRFFTPRTQPARFPGPVLVPWADRKMIEDAERLDPPAICATGWSEGGLDEWKRAWGPTDPRSGEAEAPADEAPAAIAGAVKTLSGPFGNDVLHPNDKGRAVDAFKALRLTGHQIDPVLVRRLAIQEGWSPNAANRLKKVAEGAAAGRALRGGSHVTKTKAKEIVVRFEAWKD